LEQKITYGGLCDNFIINKFRFDKFVHLSFSQNETVNRIFTLSSPDYITYIPNPFNLYKGKWIKHPAQNNLFSLDEEEKKFVIDDFKRRPIYTSQEIHNYEEWLRIQYGDYFAEHFPMAYTRKYWMSEARDLETKWIGNRLYQPSLSEVIQGSVSDNTPVTYYAKEMRYPEKGGFKSFLKELVKEQEIYYGAEVTEINAVSQSVTTKSGRVYQYDNLISSIPLPEMLRVVKDIPDEIIQAGRKLKWTCGYQVSIGLKTKNIPPYLWWYIYDEDILPARVYSPSLKSPDNAPEGCSSLQIEIYCKGNEYSEYEIYNRSVKKRIELNIINERLINILRCYEKYNAIL
jgi:protoporphyrinogen oxidase